MMRVRCKLVEFTDQPDGSKVATFEPVGNSGISSEFRLAKKPEGRFQIRVDNPVAIQVIQSTQEFYFDLSPILA